MKTLLECDLEEISLRFRAMYECDEKIEKHKEEIKDFTSSIKDTIKALAEKLEVKQKNIKNAYKEYVKSITEPEDTSEKDDVIALIQAHDLMKREKK
jgi:hypothetical protein